MLTFMIKGNVMLLQRAQIFVDRAHAVIFKLYNFDRGTVLLRQRSELQSLIEIPTLNHGIVIHLKTIKIYQNS